MLNCVVHYRRVQKDLIFRQDASHFRFQYLINNAKNDGPSKI